MQGNQIEGHELRSSTSSGTSSFSEANFNSPTSREFEEGKKSTVPLGRHDESNVKVHPSMYPVLLF